MSSMIDDDVRTAPASAAPTGTASAAREQRGARAREIGELARARRAETERDRRLPDEVMAALRGSGLVRVCRHRRWGGAEAEPESLLDVGRELARGRHITTYGVFGPPESVVCITDFPPELDVHDGTATVRAAGKKITVPAGALPALRPLLSGHPVGLAGLTATTGIDAATLAKALITAGLCTETTPGLAASYDGMIAPCRP